MPLSINAPHEADEEEYRAAVRASRDLHAPWLALDSTHEGFVTYLEKSRRDDQISLLVRDDGQLVGFVNINNIVLGAFKSGYLGYGAFKGGEGRCLMTEAISQVIDFAFGKKQLHRLEANIQPSNVASLALVRKLGFRKEGFSERYLFISGQWRDHERWALTAEDRFQGRDAAPEPGTLW